MLCLQSVTNKELSGEMMAENLEDAHFYLDNAPPTEVSNVLRVLSLGHDLTLKEISVTLRDIYGFLMQKDLTYSPRRLYDLGLATQIRRGSTVTYRLAEMGSLVQNILSIDPPFAMDLMHYLHYSGYKGDPVQRKYLWSYRRCCEIVWGNMSVISPTELASAILGEMRDKFELNYEKKIGARFNDKAVGQVYSWLRSLEPSPIKKGISSVFPRTVDRYELALLALDDTYQTRQYTYGDPVIMDDNFIKQVSGVFMLDSQCCKELLQIGSRLNQSLKISETLSGPAISLMKPFKIDNI